MMTNKELGFLGENIAGRYLESKAYSILDRNTRLLGQEIDLITKDGEVMVFVEVKTNLNNTRQEFAPELRVDARKIGHISKAARAYLQNANLFETEWRIDIISVVIDSVSKTAKIKHFKNITADFY